jgi:hypothetical protein
MFRLTVKNAPARLDILPGLVVVVRPLTTAISEAAIQGGLIRAIADQRRAMDHKEAGGTFEDPSQDATDANVLEGLAAQYECEGLARYGIVSWEGVGDDEGLPAEVTAENVRRLMSFPGIARIFRQQYRSAFVLASDAEAGFSERSSVGGSGAAPIAETAPAGQPPATQSTTMTAPDALSAPAS